MSAQFHINGFQVDYDEQQATVSANGKVVQEFKTTDQSSAQVQAIQWLKHREPVETDKAVVDAHTVTGLPFQVKADAIEKPSQAPLKTPPKPRKGAT
jgi:hypothetical protein